MKSKKRIRYYIAILVILIFTAGTTGFTAYYSRYKRTITAEQTNKVSLSAWIADWDYSQGVAEYGKISSSISQLQLFAAYFNTSDNMILTDKFRELKSSLAAFQPKNRPQLYLTVVNDIVTDSGTSVQKDSDLIRRLLKTTESRQKHIDDLIKLTQQNGITGIELDYEKIPQDSWDSFADFCKELYKRTSELDMPLRIILETNNKLDKSVLPIGPQYVIMLYNLYGTHSGPGPKADYEFIKRSLKKFNEVPGKENIAAFATGGFDWVEGGRAAALTEEQADKLVKQYKADKVRDIKSGVLYFSYTDDTKKSHTVWYADNETINGWINISREQGYYNIALWRLGGSAQATLDYINGNR